MLMQYRQSGSLVISVEELRDLLQLGNKYSRFFNLKKTIIDSSMLEISKKTNYKVTCTTIKKGRSVKKLHFNFIEHEKTIPEEYSLN